MMHICDRKNSLFVISFEAGAEAGIALVTAVDATNAERILRNSGKYNGDPQAYKIRQTRNIGLSLSIRTELLMESYVNALTAYEAIIRAANKLIGPKGDKGDSVQGDPGLSAYEIAVQNGFVGSEQDWLDSLVASVPVDSELSDESANPVQNRTVKHEFDRVREEIASGQSGLLWRNGKGEVSVESVYGYDAVASLVGEEDVDFSFNYTDCVRDGNRGYYCKLSIPEQIPTSVYLLVLTIERVGGFVGKFGEDIYFVSVDPIEQLDGSIHFTGFTDSNGTGTLLILPSNGTFTFVGGSVGDGSFSTQGATAFSDGGIALGSFSVAFGQDSVAIGVFSGADEDGVALGTNAIARGRGAVAIGRDATAENGEIALGSGGEYHSWEENDRYYETAFRVGDPGNNAHILEILNDGSVYAQNIGGYDGTNPQESQPLQEVLSSFITKAVNDLVNYYSKTEIDQLISAIQGLSFVSVSTLPAASADTMKKIYLVPSADPQQRNVKDEFITVEESGVYVWEQIGSTAVNMEGYVTDAELNATLTNYVTSSAFQTALAGKANDNAVVHKEGSESISGQKYFYGEGIVVDSYANIEFNDLNETLDDVLRGKQNTISDLSTIRSGAAAGAIAYQKPSTGIPASDLASGVIPDVSNFITKSVNDLVNYYTKSQTYTQAEVNNLIGSINQFHYEIAASTSAVSSPSANVLYLIGPTGSGADKYEEYVYANNAWVKIGDTSIDLSGYVTTQALNTALAGKQDTISDLATIRSGAAAGAAAYQKPSAGIPASDLASGVIPDVSGKENTTNKVQILSSSSTDAQYPSAKAVYDALPKELSDLSDVSDTAPTDGQALLWDGTNEEWKPGTVQGGGGSVTDVTVGGTSVVNQQGVAEVPAIPEGVQAQEIEIDSAPTANSTNLVTSGGVAAALAEKYEKPSTGIPASDLADDILPIIPTASTIPAAGLAANKHYTLGELTGTVAVTLDTTTEVAGQMNIYSLVFTAGATAPTITWPASITKWAGNCLDSTTLAPVITGGNTYEVSIVDGLAVITEFVA